tara:strand:- start:49 stop:393 length:345 start_codon:yes stop_codon:yes gene_type:complete
MKDNKKHNGWANRPTWTFTLHLDNSEEFYILVNHWLKDNLDRKDDKDFGTMFINDLQDLMKALMYEQEVSHWGVTNQGKRLIKLYIAMGIDISAKPEEICPVDVRKWLLEKIET